MIPYIVVYQIDSEGPTVQVFLCHADDAEHAIEQCKNAYSGCRISSVLPA
jgi:hypothetical protein